MTRALVVATAAKELLSMWVLLLALFFATTLGDHDGAAEIQAQAERHAERIAW